MSRERDVRDFTANRATPGRRRTLDHLAAEVSERLPGSHRVRVTELDSTTGNPAALVSEGAPVETGNYVGRALEYLQTVAPALGLEAAAGAPEFVADPQVQETSSGARAVKVQQSYKGIPIFQSATTVRFAPNGALADAVGSTTSVEGDVPVHPTLSASEAVTASG